jgi:hypothetical protein
MASDSVEKIQDRLEKFFRCVDVSPVTDVGQGRNIGLWKNLPDQGDVIVLNIIRLTAADK